MTNKRSPFIPLAVLTFLTGAVFIITNAAKADEPCKSPEALSHLENVKQNQPRIAENRDAAQRVKDAVESEAEMNPDDVEGYNEFVRNKAWNESENDALHKLGCRIKWDTLELEPGSEELHAAAGYDIDKLAKAVAIHETGDCTAKVGAALYNNCHGFRKNNRFLRFAKKQESYAYFEDLWQRNYGGMPDLRLATAYVCGWQHLKKNGTGTPCSGGNPNSWLASVTSIYETL